MFDKLKKRLTLIYTGIFALIMALVLTITLVIGGVSVVKNEKEFLIEDIYDEWREWTGSGELPVDPVMVQRGEMMSLMYDAGGNIVVDQMTGSPYAPQLMSMRDKWPAPQDATEMLYFKDGCGEWHFFLAGGCTFWENGSVKAEMYTFRNFEDYYDMAVDGLSFVLLLGLVCLVLAAGGGYYMAGKNITPMEVLFKREHDFAADASHELRTPLTVLSLGIESLQNDDESTLSSFARETLADMQHEVKYMTNLTAALLTLARSDENGISLTLQKINFAALLNGVCAKMRPLAEQKGLALVLAAPEELFVQADKDKLEQLVIILIDNAIKYSDSGTITAQLSAEGGQAVLKVLDEGIGISTGEAEYIFERFYRVDKARSRAAGGFGLGLSIARWIAQKHGGSITAAPRPGKGSVFTVRLPLSR